jgi:hypothetical protein
MNKTFTNFKNRLLAAVAIAIFSAMPAFAQLNFIDGPTANGTSGLNRGPSGAADFQRTSTFYLASEFSGLLTGPINSVAFNIATPAATAATGNIKIYMANTTATTNTRGTSWASILTTPTAMELVYDGPLTIPTTAGFFGVTLTTPFAYTGGNFDFAYEWTATTKSATSAVYNANADLAGSLNTIAATTLAGTASLTGSSAFRPVLRLGVPAPPNDMDVRAIFVQGKMALNGGGPQVIKALVKNNGANTLTNRVISLNVTGANTFTSSVTLASLAPGEDSLISFAPFTPTTLGTANLAEVTVVSDDVLGNNSQEANIMVTAGTQGYANYGINPNLQPAVVTALSGVYPATGPTATTRNANFLVKFTSTGRTRVNTVKAYVPGAAFNPIVNTTGATVYGVVFNSAGVEIARSANVVLAAADVDKLVTFTLTTPATLENGDVYYVGMALPAQSIGTPAATIYGMGVQLEQNGAIRPGTFYVSPVGGTGAPVDFEDEYRFVIEADITDVTGVKEELNAKLVSVYPNPSNGVFNISAKDMKGSNLSLEVRDLQGKLVYSANAAKEGASINLKNVASGIYMLQVTTDSEVAIKRLVVQ